MVIDDQDPDGQTLLFWYLSVTAPADTYIRPAVKIESGAKSALEPHCVIAVRPDVSKEVPGISLEVANVTTVLAERTFWDKVIILLRIPAKPNSIPEARRTSFRRQAEQHSGTIPNTIGSVATLAF